MENYSVLMSVYYKENPEYLRESISSIWNQTVPTDDFVLVCDGPLTDDLNQVVEEMESKHDEMHVVRLPKNMGLGIALNEGIKYCKNDIIARMDSDDISAIDRCERQLKIFESNDSIDIVSGTVAEFSVDVNSIDSYRRLPEQHNDIVNFAKTRNPFNHPCIMYRKESVQKAGGYQDFYLLEDYYLWIRMILNGSIGYNIPDVILFMRAGENMYLRRSGKKYALSQIRFFKFMYENKFISFVGFVKSSFVRTVASLIPNAIRKFLFETILRK